MIYGYTKDLDPLILLSKLSFCLLRHNCCHLIVSLNEHTEDKRKCRLRLITWFVKNWLGGYCAIHNGKNTILHAVAEEGSQSEGLLSKQKEFSMLKIYQKAKSVA